MHEEEMYHCSHQLAYRLLVVNCSVLRREYTIAVKAVNRNAGS